MGRMAQTALLTVVAFVLAAVLYGWVEVLHLGGIVMIPIVMCSIFSLTLIGERFWYFFAQLGKDLEPSFEQLRVAVERRQWQEAERLCQRHAGPVARVVMAGLAVREAGSQEIDEAMEEAAHAELPEAESHLRGLSTLAQVSTLLGLLGTVTGLVRAFQIIQVKAVGANPVSPADLAGGVWEALITTVAGLVVAIPTILAYNYFVSRLTELQFQMEKAAALVSGWRRRGTKGA